MPDISRIFIPKRISAVLRRIYSGRVTIIAAPDGMGKSAIIREFLSRSRPKGISVRFITSSESTGNCFSQISMTAIGTPEQEPLTDGELAALKPKFSAEPQKPLIIVVDCEHAGNTLLGNHRTAQLLASAKCARFVFLCSSFRRTWRKLAGSLHIQVIGKEELTLTQEETAEYAKYCGVSVDPREVHRAAGGAFLGTRLCFMLAQQGKEFANLTPDNRLLRAVLEEQPVRMQGALITAAAFSSLSQYFCGQLRAFSSITDFFGADLFTQDEILSEMEKLREIIPLLEINRRQRTIRFHPALRRGIYTVFFWFPENVRHDLRICYAREFLRQGKDFSAFCEYFLAGEFELSASIRNSRITYYTLIRSSRLLQRFINECPLSCKAAMPRIMRTTSLLMHSDLKPALQGKFQEFISFISSSGSYHEAERRSMLCYAYALRTTEDFYALDRMGANIKRAYDLFRGGGYDNPIFPWTLYSPSVFFLIHTRGHSVQTEAAQFTRYQHMYDEMINHGKYTDIVFSGELRYCTGDLRGALELLSGAVSLCTGSERTATLLTALYASAKCCLFMGDHQQFFEYTERIIRIQRQYYDKEEGDCAQLLLGLLRALRGGGVEDMWFALSAGQDCPLRNRFTAPYFELIRAEYFVSREKYAELVENLPPMLSAASAVGNEAVGILLRLSAAQSLLALGNSETAIQLGIEAMSAAADSGIPAIPAEFFVRYPELLQFLGTVITPKLAPVLEETQVLSSDFRRGLETVRTYEMTYLSNKHRDNYAEHYLVPLDRLTASSRELREKLGLSEMAFRYAVMAASGVSNREMSSLFTASENSIKSSLKRTYAQLGVKKRRELIGVIPTLK